MEVDEDDEVAREEWPAWNPAVFVVDNGQQIPQHPAVPQDHLDLELSGSSMHFLRGVGLEIDLDEVFQNISDDGSSSSSDASSVPVEERARFVATQARCANILIFGRKGMPSEVFTRGSGQLVIREPIIVDRNAVQAALPSAPAVTTCLEIVPWKPVRDVIALQLLPAIIQSRCEARISKKSAPATLVIILGGPNDSSPPHFEFQMGQN
jgi:hypothetical protein